MNQPVWHRHISLAVATAMLCGPNGLTVHVQASQVLLPGRASADQISDRAGQPVGAATNSETAAASKTTTRQPSPAAATLASSTLPRPQLPDSAELNRHTDPRPVTDIRLGVQGRLAIRLIDHSGKPLASQTIVISLNGQKVAAAQTSPGGQVVVSGLRPGVHHVQSDVVSTAVRLWPSRTAPPGSRSALLLVDSSSLVRGQYGYGPPIGSGLFAATVTAVGVGAVLIGKNSSSGNSASQPASP